MKTALDEHVPPALVGVITALSKTERIRNEVCSARDYSPGPGALTDVPWITAFVERGGEIIVSGDKEMRSVPHVLKAIEDTGVISYYLPTRWNNFPMEKKAGFLLSWWDKIVQHSRDASKGSSWLLPPNFESGEIKRLFYTKD